MSAKIVIVFCIEALFIQSSLSHPSVTPEAGLFGLGAPCDLAALNIDLPYGYAESAYYGIPCEPSAWSLPPLEFSPTTSGPLPVTSSSPLPPSGISVVSDNIFEGALEVTGELPFVGSVAMDGAVPTIGAGLISHACGNGVNAMVSEINAYAPSAYVPGHTGFYAPGLIAHSLGYRSEWADRGCGCGW